MATKQVAVHVVTYNEDPAKALEVVESEVPEPGQGEVLVEISMRPVDPADIFSIQGVYPGFAPKGRVAVPGLEGVGRVYCNGPGTKGTFKKGQRVVAVPWPTQSGHGTWAQFVLAPEKALVAVPDELSDEAACQFVVNPLTAVAFFEILDLPQGGWLLSNAAGSVLGRMVIKLAKKKGIHTVNIVRRREQVEELKQIGADAVVVSTEEDVVARVKEITGGGADAALDPVAGEGFANIVASVVNGGTVLLFGAMESFTATFNVPDVLFRDVDIQGMWLNNFMASFGERRDEVLQETMDLMVEGVLEPYIGKKFELQDVKEAVKEMTKPGRGGKVLLVSSPQR